MSDAGEEKVTRVFTVRDRPVGYQPGRWGGALVAVERGEFPISPTGFRSLSGAGESAVTLAFLESLADAHARERRELLQRLQEAQKPVGDPIYNYIHISGAYEQAIQYGFFATDRERTALWSGAHQLLCRVDSDRRFQPAPDNVHVAWKQEHCDAALTRAREFKTLLARLAAGELPKELPMRLLGANAYLQLPERPGGEPKVELGGFTAGMALELPLNAPQRRANRRAEGSVRSAATPSEGTQLGLFAPTVATKFVHRDAPRPRIGGA